MAVECSIAETTRLRALQVLCPHCGKDNHPRLAASEVLSVIVAADPNRMPK